MAKCTLGRDSNNRLTRYSLACGYNDIKEKDNIRITLWYEGDNCFHVRKHDFNNGIRLFWDTFDNRLEAYKHFNQNSKGFLRISQ
jgi:hypothetical protein